MSFKTDNIFTRDGLIISLDDALWNLTENANLKEEQWQDLWSATMKVALKESDTALRDKLLIIGGEQWRSHLNKQEVASPQNLPMSPSLLSQIEEELCHFVHPTLDEEGQKKVHKEIKNLVAHHQLKDIIKYLKHMAAEKRILLPQSADNAYKELVRMGMPDDEKGFSLKTFYREY